MKLGEALIYYVFCKHRPSCSLIFDEDKTFLLHLMQHINKRLGIRIKAINSYNHGSIIL